ncbi:MAG: hypothetical protein EPO22_06870 [Dehalococcoidia bacterium]|nr:MAG: hypothetical protein EPO22_06870 [Dehalococcoidia bacterium]
MIRRGELRNRIVARPGGFAYLVYLPNSWHAQFAVHAHHAAEAPPEAVGPPSWQDRTRAAWTELSQSLRRALRLVEAEGPFARYRWLARRRRWWRF